MDVPSADIIYGWPLPSSATEETTVEDDMEGERRGTNSSGMSRNGGGFESSNTLSEYLNAGDLYDSLKGEGVDPNSKSNFQPANF